MDFSKATHAQLDAHYAEHARVAIDGWAGMKVTDKRAALANMAAGPNVAVEPALEDAPKDTVTITITDAMSNPMPLFVHGVGSWSLRIGETYSLPVEAVSALRNSDVKFDEV